MGCGYRRYEMPRPQPQVSMVSSCEVCIPSKGLFSRGINFQATIHLMVAQRTNHGWVCLILPMYPLAH